MKNAVYFTCRAPVGVNCRVQSNNIRKQTGAASAWMVIPSLVYNMKIKWMWFVIPF